jgi:DNA-directed RNA polymerase specialized sigma24 family protein
MRVTLSLGGARAPSQVGGGSGAALADPRLAKKTRRRYEGLVSGPSHDELFAALSRLRELSPEDAARERTAWSVVERWLRANHPRGREADDVHQETLIAIARRVSSLEAEHAGAAVRWVSTIRKRKFIDLIRNESRSPARLGLSGTFANDDVPTPVDLLERDDARAVDPEALELLVEAVEVAIGEHADATYTNAIDRQLRRLQGRAMLHRALGQDLEGIRAALALGPELGADRIYKWIERGRPVLLAALARLRAEASEESLAVIEALAELASSRRIDAGRPRPDRASKAGEG